MQPDRKKLLHQWYSRIRATQTGHYQESKRLKTLHLMLGIPAVIVSAIVGTSTFASLADEKPSNLVTIFLGMGSITTTVLTSLQTFLNYEQKSSRHLTTATQLSNLKKEIELKLVVLDFENNRQETDQFLENVLMTWNKIVDDSPLAISNQVWNKYVQNQMNDDYFPSPRQSNFSQKPESSD